MLFKMRRDKQPLLKKFVLKDQNCIELYSLLRSIFIIKNTLSFNGNYFCTYPPQVLCVDHTCLFLISSFFSSRNMSGIPPIFSWALRSKSHSSSMKMRAFLAFKNPVKLICISLPSGNCKNKLITTKINNAS